MLLVSILLLGFTAVHAADKPNIVLVFMDNFGWSVKWRNWKLHLKEQDNILSGTIDYGMPRVYNLYKVFDTLPRPPSLRGA